MWVPVRGLFACVRGVILSFASKSDDADSSPARVCQALV